ncbi:MAG: DUF3267 domain-containing protein [Chloroflexota bacterium]
MQFGDLPQEPDTSPVGENWHRIYSPGLRLGYLLAGVIGLAFPNLLCAWLIAVSMLERGGRGGRAAAEITTPWGAVIAALLLFIPLHELLHAIWHPGLGRSAQTVLVVWPARLRFGVYYDGCMTRRRWLLMRLAPLAFLSVGPVGLLTLFYFVPAPFGLKVFLQVLMLVNGIGSGGDLVAAIWVLFQVPPRAQICFRGGRAYWRARPLSFPRPKEGGWRSGSSR